MRSVFLSYARGDDDEFVARTHEFLSANGFRVWWDKCDMPSRSLTFTEEIRNAIHNVDRLIVVVGPRALRSDYVRAEWQMALSEYKPVVPLLRRVPPGTSDTYSCLPAELRNFLAPSFIPVNGVEPPLSLLARILNEPVPPPVPILGKVPELPPHFHPRPDDFTRIFEAVLGELTSTRVLTGAHRVTVLSGMGGIGKTVLAASLVHALRSRPSTFLTDGIYWLDEPSALQLARISGVSRKALGDESTLATALTRRFLNKRFLLVVDNARSTDQIAPLIRILGSSGRMLVTTRYGELATGHVSIHLDEMREPDALRLMADWIGKGVEALPPEARRVAKLCGFHPFALSLNAAAASQGLPWSAIVAALENRELDFIKHRFDEYIHETIKHSIQVSLEGLDEMHRDAAVRYRELAAFFWQSGVPASAITRFWARQGGLPQHHCERLLVFLQQRSLIELRGAPPEIQAYLHDLHVAFIEQDRGAVRRLNDALLASYRPPDPNGWSSVPDDGYLYDHLVSHLDRAHATEEMLALFVAEDRTGANAWYGARMNSDSFDGYVEDLQLASRSMENCLLVLIMSSLHSLAKAVPAHLLVAAVEQGRWSVERAMAHARLPAEPAKRANAMIAVLPYVKERASWLNEALNSIEQSAVEDRESSVSQLAKLALDTELLPVLQRVTTWLREADSPFAQNKCVSLVQEILRRIPTGLAQEAVRAVEGTPIQPLRLYAMLDEPERSKRINKQLERNRDFREDLGVIRFAVTVAVVVDNLGREANVRLLSEALAAIRTLKPGVYRTEGLIELLPHLEAGDQNTVLEELIAVAVDKEPRLFARLARSTPPALHKPLRKNLETQNLTWIANAAPYFCDEDREALVERVLVEMEREPNWSSLLWMDGAELITVMSERQLERARTLAKSYLEGNWKVTALTAVARMTATKNRDRAITDLLASIEELGDADQRANAFHELAPLLSGHYLDDALSAAQRIGERSEREHLDRMLQYLLDSKICAIENTQTRLIEEDLPAEHARTQLARLIVADGASQRGTLIMAMVHEIPAHFCEAEDRPWVAAAYGLRMAALNEASTAFNLLLLGRNDVITATALVELAAYLSKDQVLAVEARLRSADLDNLSIPVRGARLLTWGDLARDYLGARLAPSLARIGEIGRAREYVLKADEEWRPAAWLGIAAATSGSAHSSALLDALMSALQLPDHSRREHLDKLAHAIAAEPALRVQAWRNTIQWGRTRPRCEAIEALTAFVPLAAAVGGEALVGELHSAIRRVLRWWP